MRLAIDLSGTWDFVADLDPRYHARHGGYQNPGANRRHWLKVPVPGVWQTYGERYDIYEGVGWFAREFQVPDCAPHATARLRFGAVNYRAAVYVNGQLAGCHEGGYTEFVVDLTGRLCPGTNHLAVQVDNRASAMLWPPVIGYFNYGGIHREVVLEILDGPVLEDLALAALPGDLGWELAVTGRVAGLPEASPGLVRIASGDGLSWEEQTATDGVLAARVPFPGAPSWSPESPHLEPIVVELLDPARRGVDRQEFHFGFRTVGTQGGQVLLNGQPYPLKGICYVYDSPVTGLTMAPEQIEVDLQLIKQAGGNAVRCHYPMDRQFYAACDRLGLLVWIEPPVYCYHPAADETGTQFAEPRAVALAQQMVREMIHTARNHPSVAIYGIGNECHTAHPEAAPFFAALAAVVRETDPARLVSYAALYGNVGPLAGLVDVLGVNSYWGWYDQIRQDGSDSCPGEISADQDAVPCRPIDLLPLRNMLDKVLAGQPDQALLLTKFGADSVPGFRSRCRDLWSEDYHADLLREILAAATAYPQIAGTFPFCFSDYRDPSKVHNGYWNERNLKGMVDYHRNPKQAFAAIREAYTRPT